MLFAAFSQFESSPFQGLVTLASFSIALVVAITFHEFSHAVSATGLGDPTPRYQGRLSLNPKDHLDPVGSLMILFAGFGWGKPVQVSPWQLRPGPRPGMALVSLAGPLANVALAALAAIPIRAGIVDTGRVGFTLFRGDGGDVAGYVLGSIVFWNLLLAAFNLIPVAPLDGFKVALGILPREMAASFARTERYGPVILLLVIASDWVLGTRILASIVGPIINALSTLVLGSQLL